MKSLAPAFMPRTARSTDPQAVISTTGSRGCARRIAASSWSPSSPVVRREKFMSCMTSSQGFASSHARAAAGPATAYEAYAACLSTSASDAVTDGSSSTMRIIRT